jgi:hypothetical protein
MTADRPVLVHYHIFKNAGSSVDFALERSFGSGWTSFEGRHAHDVQTSEQLRQFLEDRPEIHAVSSHLARPPLPFPGCKPILFLRHPLLRARSVYEFVRRNPEQQEHTPDQPDTFSEYVRWALESGRTEGGNNVLNYQVIHLSDASWRTHILKSEAWIQDLAQAKSLLESWGIVGIVEDYKMSTRRFQAAYARYFPRFDFVDVRANRTSSEIPDIASQTAAMREELGPALFHRLTEANQLDLDLYNWAVKQFSRMEDPIAAGRGTRWREQLVRKNDDLEGPGTWANELTVEKLRDELRYLGADWEALVAYKADVTAQLDALVRVRETEMAEHEALAHAHGDLIARHETLVRLRDVEIAEHAALAHANADLIARHDRLARLREDEIVEHEALARAHSDLIGRHETLVRLRDAEIAEHAALARAHCDLNARHETLVRLRDEEIAEHAALAQAHGDLVMRYDKLARVRDEEIAEHESLARAHNDLLAQFETLTRIRNGEIEDHAALARAYRDLVAQLQALPRR